MTFETNRSIGATDPVTAALVELRRGRMVLVVDDEDRENEGDLIMAAEMATSEAMAFMIRHTTGLVCVAMTDGRAEELQLPLMVSNGDDPRRTAFTVSVDLKEGTSTGVSASDRALTIRALADLSTHPHQLCRPGHVFPLRARPGGVLERDGHTESAVDLCRLAGLAPVGVLAEIVNDDGTMARRPQLKRFATEHGLAMLAVPDIVQYRVRHEAVVQREAAGRIPTRHGEFTAISLRTLAGGIEHVALVLGDVDQTDVPEGSGEASPILTRVQSECLTGDVFGSQQCDCSAKLEQSMTRIGAAGRGVIVYLRDQKRSGHALIHALRSGCVRGQSTDPAEADTTRLLLAESRELTAAASILATLGVRTVALMTNNPNKCGGLRDLGVQVSGREPLEIPVSSDTGPYPATKEKRADPIRDQLLVS
ncbi:3,4-dihydroxy-2-butanone-4-phosphate synthase [Mycobacterium avium]|uniref:3,4-dihydroxy-2-butanone-4-phosphate synthase n=1 Tax=Mycobacterium avium TaxID=1764 RepID=UPI0007A0C903|nr:3,4-dihydroxy-2-butanone-4-phosphate synthase [Mycobacterium avium]